MNLRKFNLEDIERLDSRYRRQFMNSIEGFKNLALIGTRDHQGHTNLALFSSVVHIGASPPLIGFIHRPVSVPKQTFTNIQLRKYYTINLVHEAITEAAHQTSARYEPGQSEFEATGLTPVFTETVDAPYVEESKIRFGLIVEEILPIRSNGTFLIIGKVLELFVPEKLIREDGFVELSKAGVVACAGLDSYYLPQPLTRLEYARPDRAIRKKS